MAKNRLLTNTGMVQSEPTILEGCFFSENTVTKENILDNALFDKFDSHQKYRVGAHIDSKKEKN